MEWLATFVLVSLVRNCKHTHPHTHTHTHTHTHPLSLSSQFVACTLQSQYNFIPNTGCPPPLISESSNKILKIGLAFGIVGGLTILAVLCYGAYKLFKLIRNKDIFAKDLEERLLVEEKGKKAAEGVLDEMRGALTIKYSEILKGRFLGKGTSGFVYAGTWHGIPIALKELVLSSAMNETAQESLCELDREATAMYSLNHHNVVRFLGAGMTEQSDGTSLAFLVTEYMELGCLRNILYKVDRQGKVVPPKIKPTEPILNVNASLENQPRTRSRRLSTAAAKALKGDMRVCVCVCVCIYIYIYMCVCVCVCVCDMHVSS